MSSLDTLSNDGLARDVLVSRTGVVQLPTPQLGLRSPVLDLDIMKDVILKHLLTDKGLDEKTATQCINKASDYCVPPLQTFQNAQSDGHPLSLLGHSALVSASQQIFANKALLEVHRDHFSSIPRIESPVFIIGFDRISNTVLQTVLTALPGFTTPTFAESILPFGPTPFSRKSTEPKARDQEATATLKTVKDIVADFACLFPESSSGCWEDTLILEMSGRCPSLGMKAALSEYIEWLENPGELDGVYENYHRPAMEAVSLIRHSDDSADQKQRWVFNSSYHMLGLAGLQKTYPDATFIFIESSSPSSDAGLLCGLARRFRKTLTRYYPDFGESDRMQLQAVVAMTNGIQKLVESSHKGCRIIRISADCVLSNPLDLCENLVSMLAHDGKSHGKPESVCSSANSSSSATSSSNPNRNLLLDVIYRERERLQSLGKLKMEKTLEKLMVADVLIEQFTSHIMRCQHLIASSIDPVDHLLASSEASLKSSDILRLVSCATRNGTSKARIDEELKGLSSKLSIIQTSVGLTDPMDDIRNFSKAIQKLPRQGIQPAPVPSEIKNILITGASGFVGSFILLELLSRVPADTQNGGVERIVCLVRCLNEHHGLARLKKQFNESFLPWNDHIEQLVSSGRLRVVRSSISSECLGLEINQLTPNDSTSSFMIPHFPVLNSEDGLDYSSLSMSIDCVVHIAGAVEFIASYEQIRKSNVVGTFNVLKFCATGKRKHLHFASTLGQFPACFTAFSDDLSSLPLSEFDSPDAEVMRKHFPLAIQGYAWSKWVAEEILQRGRQWINGLPVIIHRFPHIFVSAKSGFMNPVDQLPALLKASLQEGIFPEGSPLYSISPVDTVAEIVVKSMFQTDRLHDVYHLCNTKPISASEFYSITRELTLNLKLVPAGQFFDAIESRGPLSPAYNLLGLLRYWEDQWFRKELALDDDLVPICTSNLADDQPNIQWPDTAAVVERIFLNGIRSGLFASDSLGFPSGVDDIIAKAKETLGWNADDEAEDREIESLSEDDPRRMADSASLAVQPYRLLVETTRRDNVTFGGKLIISRNGLQTFINCFAFRRIEKIYPEIISTQIHQPIFIVGLNRTGTTLLHRVLSLSKHCRGLNTFEMIMPYGMDGAFNPMDSEQVAKVG